MSKNDNATEQRVDIVVDFTAPEFLPEEIYTVHSPSGIWVVEENAETIIRAYPEHIETYLAAIRESGIEIRSVRIVDEKKRDYASVARQYFRPIRVEDIVIRAPWNSRREGITYITIEPGMAFGTGRHESTRLMMRLMKDVDFTDKTVLDIGCGSGLLALYARLKGAKNVYAVDNDIDAVLSAQNNVRLNNLDSIEIVCAELKDIGGRYDIVLANLDIRTFGLSSGHIMQLWRKQLIISGIIGREKKNALKLFLPCEPDKEVKKNAWRGYLFTR